MDQRAAAHRSVKLCRDIAKGSKSPAGLQEASGASAYYIVRRPPPSSRRTGKLVSILWIRAQNRKVWRRDATALPDFVTYK